MELNKNTGSIITQEKAKALITGFKTKFPGEVTSSFIGANNVNNILNQENCIGIRIHNGYDSENEKLNLVLVGVDENGKEILDNGIIYDKVLLCPDYCPIDGLTF